MAEKLGKLKLFREKNVNEKNKKKDLFYKIQDHCVRKIFIILWFFIKISRKSLQISFSKIKSSKLTQKRLWPLFHFQEFHVRKKKKKNPGLI